MLLTFPVPAAGQVSGVVQTADGRPIPAVSIQVWAQAELLAEDATDNRGLFSFDVPQAEVRRVRAAHLGFETAVIPGRVFSSGPQTIQLRPLPVPLPEISVEVTRSVCDENEDPTARAFWSDAASGYSQETGYRGGSVAMLYASGHIPPTDVGQVSAVPNLEPRSRVWVGATDTVTPGRYLLLERRIENSGYVQPPTRWSAHRSENWAYPELEGRYAYHFATSTFGERHSFHWGSGGEPASVVFFCPKDRDPPSIQGRLYFGPDSTFLKADWSFRTRDPVEAAGGEVVFGKTPDPSGIEHLVSAQGFFWRRELRGPDFKGVPRPFFQIVRIARSWAVSEDDSMPSGH